MSIYQFELDLIPRLWVKTHGDCAIDLLFDGDLYDMSIAWENFLFDARVKLLLSNILPLAKSWNDNLFIWGDIERNDIQLLLIDNKIDHISIRFDVKDNTDSLKIKIIDLAKKLDCYFLFPEFKQIASSNIKSLNNAISRSNAAKYIKS